MNGVFLSLSGGRCISWKRNNVDKEVCMGVIVLFSLSLTRVMKLGQTCGVPQSSGKDGKR